MRRVHHRSVNVSYGRHAGDVCLEVLRFLGCYVPVAARGEYLLFETKWYVVRL